MTTRLLLHRLGSTALVVFSIRALFRLWQFKTGYEGQIFLACLGLSVGAVWWFAVWILKR